MVSYARWQGPDIYELVDDPWRHREPCQSALSRLSSTLQRVNLEFTSISNCAFSLLYILSQDVSLWTRVVLSPPAGKCKSNLLVPRRVWGNLPEKIRSCIELWQLWFSSCAPCTFCQKPFSLCPHNTLILHEGRLFVSVFHFVDVRESLYIDISSFTHTLWLIFSRCYFLAKTLVPAFSLLLMSMRHKLFFLNLSI